MATKSRGEKKFRFHGLSAQQVIDVRRKMGESVEPYRIEFRAHLITSWCLVKTVDTREEADRTMADFKNRYHDMYVRIVEQKVIDIVGIGTEKP